MTATTKLSFVTPDYSWDMLIRASDPAFSCGRSPVSLEPLSIRLNRLKNRTIEPVITIYRPGGPSPADRLTFRPEIPTVSVPSTGPDFSSVPYPGAQDTRARLCHNRFSLSPLD